LAIIWTLNDRTVYTCRYRPVSHTVTMTGMSHGIDNP